MHCIILIWLIYPLDHIHAEPKLEIQEEQNLGECGGSHVTSYVDTNLALDQAKPRCI
jgi:hypothetical protein